MIVSKATGDWVNLLLELFFSQMSINKIQESIYMDHDSEVTKGHEGRTNESKPFSSSIPILTTVIPDIHFYLSNKGQEMKEYTQSGRRRRKSGSDKEAHKCHIQNHVRHLPIQPPPLQRREKKKRKEKKTVRNKVEVSKLYIITYIHLE